jgi:hypothetical protein
LDEVEAEEVEEGGMLGVYYREKDGLKYKIREYGSQKPSGPKR